MQYRGVDDMKGFIKTAGGGGGAVDRDTDRQTDGHIKTGRDTETQRDMMMMTMMMKMNSRRMEMNEDGKKRKKKGGHEDEETRLKESQPTSRRPRSTLPASVNKWRPTISKLIHSDRLCAIKAFLYYPYSDC